jgi:hypothetical protein
MNYLSAYRQLIEDDFTPRDARRLLWQIWRTKYFPYRLYRMAPLPDDFDENPDAKVVFDQITWNWRGRVLWRKDLTSTL